MSGLKDRMHALGSGAAVDVSTVAPSAAAATTGAPVRGSTPRDDARLRREAGF